MTLEACLRPERSRLEQRAARFILSFPWCRPASGPAPRQPRPGEVLLVSVDGAQGAASLWAFEDGGEVPLMDSARNAWALVRRVVYRDFGGWRVPLVSRVPPPLARHLAPVGASAPRELTGSSYGAALLLSIVSRGLRQPVPADVVALAAVDAQGRLAAVDGLHSKLNAVAEWATTVKRVFVAADQELEPDPRFEFVRLSTAAELVDAVFGEWAPSDLEEVSLHLLRLVLAPSRPLVSWKRVLRAAELLEENPRASENARWRTTVVRLVAARHESDARGVLPALPADQSRIPRVILDRYEAHRIQQLMDSGEPDEGLVDRIANELPSPLACSISQLELAGAVGRAMARRRDYARARSLLGDVARTWLDIGLPAEAGRSFSEWVRILGIERRRADLEGASSTAQELLAEFDATGRRLDAAFCCLAMGRASIQCEQWADAERWWSACDWDQVVPWVRLAQSRWRARGEWFSQQSSAALDELASAPSKDAADLAALCQLDAAILSGRVVGPALASFRGTSGASESTWLLLGAETEGEQARRLFEESPY